MSIEFSKTAQKHISKLDIRIKSQLKSKLDMFRKDPNTPSLRQHALSGKYYGCTSINITGDYRLVFEWLDVSSIRVLAIGTHSQLYG
jgi:addiction module RelE/StbE family toxin